MGILERLGQVQGSGLYGAAATAADPGCAICSGTGFDETFGSPCSCKTAPAKPSFRRAAEVSLSTEATPVPMGARSFKANRYPGKCDLCGSWVEAEAGMLVKVEATGKYGPRHLDGQCKVKTAAAPAAAPAAQFPGIVGADVVIVNKIAKKCSVCSDMVEEREGRAAKIRGSWVTFCAECAATDPVEVEGARAKVDRLVDQVLATAYPTDKRQAPSLRVAIPALGDNDLDFFVLVRSDEGERTVLRTLGGHGDIPVRLVEQARQAERIAELSHDELIAAAVRYGQELGFCGRCGRSLTLLSSREAGLGPECAKL